MNSRLDRIEVRAYPRNVPALAGKFYVVDVYRDGTERIYHNSIGGSFDHCWFAAQELAEVLDCCAYAVDENGNAFKSYGEGGHE